MYLYLYRQNFKFRNRLIILQTQLYEDFFEQLPQNLKKKRKLTKFPSFVILKTLIYPLLAKDCMIAKKIDYCWFGENLLTSTTLSCLES